MWRRREGRENILTPERAFSLTGARAVAVEQARTLQKVALARPPSLSLFMLCLLLLFSAFPIVMT